MISKILKRLAGWLIKKGFIPGHVYRNYRIRTSQPSWDSLLRKDQDSWSAARALRNGKPKILMATSIGAYLPGTTMESLLAVALTLRGADVQFLLCDSALPACLHCMHGVTIDANRLAARGPQATLCTTCYSSARQALDPLGLKVNRYREFLKPEDIERARQISRETPLEDLKRYQSQGLSIGEHVLAAALRFYARGDLDGEPRAEEVLRRYLQAALLTAFAARNLLHARPFDCVVFHSGIYVPHGALGEVCRQVGVRVVNWEPAYRKHCFLFSHHESYNRILMREPVEYWERIEWSPRLEEALTGYLRSRWTGTEDWISCLDRPELDPEKIFKEIGLDSSKPYVGLLTNVAWDAQLFYPSNAFPDMMSWVIETVRYFASRPDLQLLIRVHPAEVRSTVPSRQRVVESLRQTFPDLPKNVFIIPPESRLSTYVSMSRASAALIYGTTTGIELAAAEIPIVVAGEAWIRNKGIALEPNSREEYLGVLDRLPFQKPMDAESLIRAKKYAFHFYFRLMIPVECLESCPGDPPYRISAPDLEDLKEGRSPGLDTICGGILHGSDFIFPAERYLT